jgi:protein gp37
MGDKSKISWTDATWGPVRGCSRVSAGCINCYAERVATRFSGPGQPYEGLLTIRSRHPDAGRATTGSRGRWNGRVRLVPERLADPLRWKSPRRIFTTSMSDLFHENLSNEDIAAVFGVMAACPQHTFQCLTKRAKRMHEWFEWIAEQRTPLITIPHSPRLICRAEADKIINPDNVGRPLGTEPQPRQWPLPNVWLGVSTENQTAADERIPLLLDTPAAVRFISAEPLLGPLVLTGSPGERGGGWLGRTGWHGDAQPHLQWVIIGCESGPGARPLELAWVRSLRQQCGSYGVPVWLKQLRAEPGVTAGKRSSRKGSGKIIELPYLDGVQDAAFPEDEK